MFHLTVNDRTRVVCFHSFCRIYERIGYVIPRMKDSGKLLDSIFFRNELIFNLSLTLWKNLNNSDENT